MSDGDVVVAQSEVAAKDVGEPNPISLPEWIKEVQLNRARVNRGLRSEGILSQQGERVARFGNEDEHEDRRDEEDSNTNE
jgi:hypothetical protein